MKIKNILKANLIACVFCLGITANASCSIGAGVLNFGQYNPFKESDTYASAHINVNCANESNVTIKTNSSLDYNQLRKMSNIEYPDQNDVLIYQIFTNVGRDLLFGDGNNNTHIFAGTNKEFVLYGTILKKQNVYKGVYQDNLILEIIY